MRDQHARLPPDVALYAIEHYEGKVGNERCFGWSEDGQPKHGNSTMFMEHLIAKFKLKYTPTSVYVSLSRTLCDAGLRAIATSRRRKGSGHSDAALPLPHTLSPTYVKDRTTRAAGPPNRSTIGRVVSGPLVQGADGLWREQE